VHIVSNRNFVSCTANLVFQIRTQTLSSRSFKSF